MISLRGKGLVVAAFLVVLWNGSVRASTTSVTLSWRAGPDANATGHNLHYGTSSGGENMVQNVGEATTATITGLTVGQKYYFVVRAYDASGVEGEASNEVSLTAVAPPATDSKQAPRSTATPTQPPTSESGAPVAEGDSFSAAQDALLSIPAEKLLLNDSDPSGYPLSISGASNATNGTVVYDPIKKEVTFMPAPTGYTGPASFYYSVTNGHGGKASALVTITVGHPTFSLFSEVTAPTGQISTDGRPVELGVKFKTAGAGFIKAIRFYKVSQNTGPHLGNLWSASGALLSSVAFTKETDSGWQETALANPVPVRAGTTYVVSYHSNGAYSVNDRYFENAFINGPLTVPDSASSGGNGVYVYGPGGNFPSNTADSSNYWVDVVFAAKP